MRSSGILNNGSLCVTLTENQPCEQCGTVLGPVVIFTKKTNTDTITSCLCCICFSIIVDTVAQKLKDWYAQGTSRCV